MTWYVSSTGFQTFRRSRTSTPTYAGYIYLVREDGRAGAKRCEHLHRSPAAARKCAARMAKKRPHRQTCKECQKAVAVTRSEARQQRWEPYSYSSQHTIDHGPLVCPECVTKAIDGVVRALKLS